MSLLTKWVKSAVIVAAVGAGAYVTANYLSGGKFNETLASVREETGGLVSRLQSDKMRAEDSAEQYKSMLDNINSRPYRIVESGTNQFSIEVRGGGTFPIADYKGFPITGVPLEAKLDEIYSTNNGDEIKRANTVIQKERELNAARLAAKGTNEKSE